jgi:transposase
VTASRRVVIGVDTHRDTNYLAVITDAEKPLADAEFPTSPAGYDDAVRWAQSFGTIVIAGMEGTSSYGAGLTRALQAAGIEVAEVSRPDRAARRRQANPTRWTPTPPPAPRWPATAWRCPKTSTPPPLRTLLTARRSAAWGGLAPPRTS